jgi:hypothetical protein
VKGYNVSRTFSVRSAVQYLAGGVNSHGDGIDTAGKYGQILVQAVAA